MAPKFALFTKGSKLPLNQGFQNWFLVTTVSRQALAMSGCILNEWSWKHCSISSFATMFVNCLLNNCVKMHLQMGNGQSSVKTGASLDSSTQDALQFSTKFHKTRSEIWQTCNFSFSHNVFNSIEKIYFQFWSCTHISPQMFSNQITLTPSHKSAADDFGNMWTKNREIPIKKGISTEKKLESLWQKVGLLVLSNFSFCPIVFKSRLLQRHQKVSACGKVLKLLTM